MGYRQVEVYTGLSPQGGWVGSGSNLLPQAAWPAPGVRGRRHGGVTTLIQSKKTVELGTRKEAQLQRGSFGQTEVSLADALADTRR